MSNKNFTAKALIAAMQALKEKKLDDDWILKTMMVSLDASEFYFEDLCEDDLESYLKVIIDAMAQFGYEFNGTVDYYGDYEGTIFVENNRVFTLDKEDRWKHTATVDELLEVLKSRGVTIVTIKEGK